MINNYSNSYALALYQIAKEQKKLIKYKIWGKQLLAIINNNLQIIELFNSYDISLKIKQQIINQCLSPILPNEWSNLLMILSQKRQFHAIFLIIKKMTKLINDDLKITSGIIYSTVLLTKSEIQAISKKTQSVINLPLELINKLDYHLISGLKIVINDQEFDYSLKARLDFLHSKLLEKIEVVND